MERHWCVRLTFYLLIIIIDTPNNAIKIPIITFFLTFTLKKYTLANKREIVTPTANITPVRARFETKFNDLFNVRVINGINKPAVIPKIIVSFLILDKFAGFNNKNKRNDEIDVPIKIKLVNSLKEYFFLLNKNLIIIFDDVEIKAPNEANINHSILLYKLYNNIKLLGPFNT